MPDSDAEDADIEVDRIETRQIDNLGDMWAVEHQELGVPMVRFDSSIEDFSPKIKYIVNKYVDPLVQERMIALKKYEDLQNHLNNFN